MQFNLTGHHVDITPALRDFVSAKIEKVERHFGNVTDAHIILTVEKLRHKAEATIHVSGANIYAEAIEEDMYAAIDGLVDKLDRQAKRHKEKLKAHHARSANKEKFN